jgi:hypothetical protein
MTTSRTLPARPSLESLRKQAKKLARDIAAGDAGAIARARAQLPQVDLPLSHRNAQLVLAREYGFAGWQDLTAEVSKRLGNGLEWAAAQVTRAVADGDLTAFVGGLQREPWLFGEAYVWFQTGLIEGATLNDRGPFIVAFSTSSLHYCGASRRRDRRPSSSHSPTRTHTSFHNSPASGHCQTICRMRRASATSRG